MTQYSQLIVTAIIYCISSVLNNSGEAVAWLEWQTDSDHYYWLHVVGIDVLQWLYANASVEA
jgi:hypothetical protein